MWICSCFTLTHGDWYGQDGGTDVSVRALHLLSNYKVKDARLWIKLPLAKRKPLLLRTFARNFSNIDFFLKILPWKDDELTMSEM